MNNNPEHHLSKDGSSTLYSNQFGQYYHNPNGAVSESKYVFFEASGLIKALDEKKDHLAIFEVGFGTGLNFLFLLDLYFSKDISFPVHFYSVEAYPISQEVSLQFNFSDFLKNKQLEALLPDIFANLTPGKNTIQLFLNRHIYLHLYFNSFDEIDSIEHPVNFVFHDAFSPEVNEELWGANTFKKIASFCKEDAILTTYCAASKARAALAKAGWFIGKAPGALGKREMTVASLNEKKVSHLKRVNEQRLIDRLEAGEFENKKND